MNQQMSIGTFIILALLMLTVGTQMVITHNQLRREQVEIARQYDEQTPQITSAQELRDQFNGIAGAVAQLADEGNPNAVRVREQLAQQGINIKAPEAQPDEGDAPAGD
jgi:phosphoglycerate-specific signal transduction histidine kinase